MRHIVLWLLAVVTIGALAGGVLFVRQGLIRLGPPSQAAQTATAAAARLAPPGTIAYVADGQVVVAEPGKTPRRLTAFPQPDTDPTHWGPIAWSPDTTHLAVAIGTPLVDPNPVAGATGALYVISLSTGMATLVTPHAKDGQGVAVGTATYAWEDSAQLLFAAGGKVQSFDVSSGTTSALNSFSRTTVLDLAVRRHALYYTSYAATDGPLTALAVALRRFDLATHADTQVADLGLVIMQMTGCNSTGCMAAAGVAATLPAWDVSADESELAFEQVSDPSPDRTQTHASFYFVANPAPTPATGTAPAAQATPTAIYKGVRDHIPAGLPNACCYLRFSPDGRGLALTSGYAMPQQFGPYLLYPHISQTTYQLGFPWAFGPAAWQPDGSAFSLTSHQGNAASTSLLSYGDRATQVLAKDGYDSSYAPAG
jgi:hypothetical protein